MDHDKDKLKGHFHYIHLYNNHCILQYPSKSLSASSQVGLTLVDICGYGTYGENMLINLSMGCHTTALPG